MWSHSKPGMEPGLDGRSPTVSLPVSLLFPLFILPDRLAPAGSDAGQWAGQDPVLVTARTPLVLLIKKPPRRENRSVVVSQGLEWEKGLTKLCGESFWCDGTIRTLSSW